MQQVVPHYNMIQANMFCYHNIIIYELSNNTVCFLVTVYLSLLAPLCIAFKQTIGI